MGTRVLSNSGAISGVSEFPRNTVYDKRKVDKEEWWHQYELIFILFL